MPPDADRELDLPPVHEVERALDLGEEDRREIPGLYQLNVGRVPVLRILSFQLLLLATGLHNLVVFGAVDWQPFLTLVAVVEGYALGAAWVLRRYFTRFRRFHLGTVFLVVDLALFTLCIYVMGGNESYLWPIYLLRVADQMWIGRRRAGTMALAAAACYALLLAYLVGVDGKTVSLGLELFKLFTLVAMGGYLSAAAGLPWNLQRRTQEAKDLILRLEEQSLELDRERARAEDAARAKTEFLARMSHELRTPLNSVVGFANSLLRRVGEEMGPREAAYLERIRQNGMHLLALINDILDLIQLDEGRMTIQVTPVDVPTVVRETVQQLEPRVEASPVTLTTIIPGEVALLQADEARLRQVLINLVGNAIKFTEEGFVQVVLETDPADGTPLRLHVEDSGIGIPERRLGGIFEAFEQVDGGTDRKAEGTGVGLALTRALCQVMGFEITVESTVGQGSSFTVHFNTEVRDAASDFAAGRGADADDSYG